jgi:GTPase
MSDDVSAPVELTASKETKTTIVRKKERLNLLVGGHVDTGRSTICGKLL